MSAVLKKAVKLNHSLTHSLEIRLWIKGQKYSDNGMCDDTGHIPIFRSDPINQSKW